MKWDYKWVYQTYWDYLYLQQLFFLQKSSNMYVISCHLGLKMCPSPLVMEDSSIT